MKSYFRIQLKALNDRFDTFTSKHEQLKSDLLITKNCNILLHQEIIQLEQNTASNTQYHQRESLEVNLLPHDIEDNALEKTVCRAISLTGNQVTSDDLQACHRLKNKDRVILKFKDSKKRKSSPAEIFGTLSILVSFSSARVCYENQQLAFKCRQLQDPKEIHSTWFWSNAVNIKVTPNGKIHQIFHTTDMEKLLGVESLDDFINNTSF